MPNTASVMGSLAETLGELAWVSINPNHLRSTTTEELPAANSMTGTFQHTPGQPGVQCSQLSNDPGQQLPRGCYFSDQTPQQQLVRQRGRRDFKGSRKRKILKISKSWDVHFLTSQNRCTKKQLLENHRQRTAPSAGTRCRLPHAQGQEFCSPITSPAPFLSEAI